MNGELIRMRQEEVCRYLKGRGIVTIEELSAALNTSQSTIRRDLKQLEESQKVMSFHGGVFANFGDEPFTERKVRHSKEKRLIALRAAELVASGDILYIGGGSSAYAFASALSRRSDLERVTVVTAAVNVACAFEGMRNFTVVLTGGVFEKSDESMKSPITIEFLSAFNFTKAFLGVQGLTVERGYTLPRMELAELKKAVIARTDQVILLGDHTKIGKVGSFSICPASRVGIFVTDRSDRLAPQYKKFSAEGVRFIFA